MTTSMAPPVPIPGTHLDLLARPIVGVLTTLLPDGQPQSTLVWVDHDGECPRTNTTHGAQAYLDALTRAYTTHPTFYGHVYPVAQRERETRVIVRLHARRVTLDAIHR